MAAAMAKSTSSESFRDPAPSFGRVIPEISSACSFSDGDLAAATKFSPIEAPDPAETPSQASDLLDFEFIRLDPSISMLPADELFADGKLVPLQASSVQDHSTLADAVSTLMLQPEFAADSSTRSAAQVQSEARRWRDLLGLRKATQIGGSEGISVAGSKNRSARSLKNLLQRSKKTSSIDPSQSMPLLGDSAMESDSLSSRISFSEMERVPPRVRLSPKPRKEPGETAAIPADSPRMNSSGKVVFHSLERSTSSPSTFNGGSRMKHRSMERSYSANLVRVTPVLNVPICSSKARSVFGFGNLFSSTHKKREDRESGKNSSSARNRKIEKLR